MSDDEDAIDQLDTMMGAVIHVAGLVGELGTALGTAAMLVDVRRRRSHPSMSVQQVLGARRLEKLAQHATAAAAATALVTGTPPLAVSVETIVHLVNAGVQASTKVGADVLREAVASIAMRMPCTDCNGLRVTLRSGVEGPCARCKATGIDPVQTRSEGDG